tara:strand:- start:7284 stop:9122 length:1839 start_codon:yes stop_codon:yes gene_type:complete
MISSNHDVELKVGPTAEPITCLQLMDELYKRGSIARERFLVKADRNERYVNGDQYMDINRLTGVLQDVPWQDFVPKVTVNYLRNLVLTWTSRLLRNRPSVSAYPHNGEIADAQSASAAATIIEFFEHEVDIDELMFDVVSRACAHGCGGVKLVYDPDADAVVWDPVTIFDYVMDPKEKSEDAGWIVFEKFIDENEANMLLKEAGIQDRATTVEYYVGINEYRQGVKVRELWYRPDPRVPEGLYALEVSGHVTETMEYPYIFTRLESPGDTQRVSFLPLAMFVVDPRRGTCWGDTWVNDAVPTQRQINEVESTLTKLRRDTAGAKLIAPGAIANAIDTGNQILKIDDPMQAQMVRYMEPPRINNLLFSDRDVLTKRLYDLAGLNELMVGAEAAKSGQSAKTIAYLSELDAMKQAGTARSIERFLLEAWRKTLLLVRNYYTEPRMLSIVGENNVLAQTSFIGSDIDGVGLRLEPREGTARYTASKEQEIIEHSQLGIRDQSEARSMVVDGSTSTPEDQRQDGAMSEVVQTVLRGADPYVDETVDPIFAVDFLTQAIAVQQSVGARESILIILAELLAVYEQFKNEMEAQMAPPQQAPQQQGPQGPPPPGEGFIQ